MNLMDKVSRLLGLELFDKFDVTLATYKNSSRYYDTKVSHSPYYFTDEGVVNRYGVLDNEVLPHLITGELVVHKVGDTNA